MCLNCGCDTCDCKDLQIPRGNTGRTGADGQQGAAGTNGQNGTTLLANEALPVSTPAATNLYTIRTFVLTPAMFVSGVVELDTWLDKAVGFTAGGGLYVAGFFLGSTSIGGFAGMMPILPQSIWIKTKIQKISNSSQLVTAHVSHGGNSFNSVWQSRGDITSPSVDLSVNQNITLVVGVSVGNFTAGEITSRNLIISKYT